MDNGYVKLHRKLFSNSMWLSEKFTKAQAWVDLFANANHKDGSFYVRGSEVKVKRGQIGWSEVNMAQRWGWSRNKVRRFLNVLKTEHQVIQQTEQHGMYLTSIITIVNYDMYQNNETPKRTKVGTTDGTPNGTQTMNIKNDNEESSDVPSQDVVSVIESFKGVNPNYRNLFRNKTQRYASEDLIGQHGIEKVLRVVAFLPKVIGRPFAPRITTPLQLRDDYGRLEAFVAQEKGKLQAKPKVAF